MVGCVGVEPTEEPVKQFYKLPSPPTRLTTQMAYNESPNGYSSIMVHLGRLELPLP